MDEARRFDGLSPEKRALVLKRLRQSRDRRAAPIVPRPQTQACAPLSWAQQSLFITAQLTPKSPVYNVYHCFDIIGQLNEKVLARSLDAVVERHETLRTTFGLDGDQPVQRVAQARPFPVERIDLRDAPPERRQAAALEIATREVAQPFDLHAGPLIKALLLRMDNDRSILTIVMHHIITDGWSDAILFRELGLVYDSLQKERPSALPPLSVQYADFATWERQHLREARLNTHLSYWRRRLAGISSVLPLPTDRPRPPALTFRGGIYRFTLGPVLVDELEMLARRQQSTLFMVLQAVFALLVHRYTGTNDILMGVPVANRHRPETESLVGCFVNTLPIRLDLKGKPSFLQLLDRVREDGLEAYEHQEAPFQMIVEGLRPNRGLDHMPVVQVLCVMDDPPMLHLPGLSVRRLELHNGTAKMDMSLYFARTGGDLEARIEYSTDLFSSTTINRMAQHFKTLLDSVVANPDRCISDLAMLPPEERHTLLTKWSTAEGPHPPDFCLHQMFEAQVKRTPHAVALRFNDQQITYRELNEKANYLARRLQAEGVRPETLVGLCVRRSPAMVAGLLAILKAGGAYVPIDPTYPADRISFILADARVSLLIADRESGRSLPPFWGKHISVDPSLRAWEANHDEDPATIVGPLNLAYVLYTSGSTGKPKGVAIEHRSVANLVNWAVHTFPRAWLGMVLAATSLNFDISVFELFAPLCSGGSARLADTPLQLFDASVLQQVTLINTVPSAMTELIGLIDLPESVRAINLAGERLSVRLVRELYENSGVLQVANLYGPTETAVYSTIALTAKDPEGRVPIGRPIANTEVYVLDESMHLVPTGAVGELYIGGAGLARGYLFRPDITAERFVPNPFSGAAGGTRLYRTGDLVRYRSDGELEFLGRVDNQLKIRGYRIEPEEVEAALVQHAAVDAAVVQATEPPSGGTELVAFIVLRPTETTSSRDLRGFLRRRLPDYMIPTRFSFLPQMPHSPAGKVDRRALATLESEPLDANDQKAVPRNALEKTLVDAWCGILGIERLGIHDNFFDCGGDSLVAVKLIAALNRIGMRIGLSQLFKHQTVAELAEALSGTAAE